MLTHKIRVIEKSYEDTVIVGNRKDEMIQNLKNSIEQLT
jgi:hypothetical protein